MAAAATVAAAALGAKALPPTPSAELTEALHEQVQLQHRFLKCLRRSAACGRSFRNSPSRVSSSENNEEYCLSQIVLEHCHETYLMTTKEVDQCKYLASWAVLHEDADVFCRRWLCRHDAGRGTIWWNTGHVHLQYHAARLLHVFHHSVQQGQTVIAGGSPAATCLESRGHPSWNLVDIDIFVTSEYDMDVARNIHPVRSAQPI